MEQTSLRIASAMRSTTLSSLVCADPRFAMTSWRPVRISRAEEAALTGMDKALTDAKPRCHCPIGANSRPGLFTMFQGMARNRCVSGLPGAVYELVHEHMLSCKYGDEVQDRKQDSPLFVTKRYNLFTSQHPVASC